MANSAFVLHPCSVAAVFNVLEQSHGNGNVSNDLLRLGSHFSRLVSLRQTQLTTDFPVEIRPAELNSSTQIVEHFPVK